jgi:hypothetical protein
MNNLISLGKVLIVCFWNSSDYRDGLHTVAIQCWSKNLYRVYNYYGNDDEAHIVYALQELTRKGGFIKGYVSQ